MGGVCSSDIALTEAAYSVDVSQSGCAAMADRIREIGAEPQKGDHYEITKGCVSYEFYK